MTKESTVVHGPGDTFASYECEGDKCRVYVVTKCFNGKLEWEFSTGYPQVDRLITLYTGMAELATRALKHILLFKDSCGKTYTYGDLYAMTEWVAGLLRSAVNFKRHSSLYNWEKVVSGE